jgi:hypothetical protein
MFRRTVKTTYSCTPGKVSRPLLPMHETVFRTYGLLILDIIGPTAIKCVWEQGVRIRILETKVDEGTGSWRKLHSEELHNLYSSLNIIRVIKWNRMRMGGSCSTHNSDKNLSSSSSLTWVWYYKARSEFRRLKLVLPSTSWSSYIPCSYWFIFKQLLRESIFSHNVKMIRIFSHIS